MDPDETVRKLRDAMIVVSEMLSHGSGPTSLTDDELDALSWAGYDIREAANNLIEWVGKGGFRPSLWRT